MVDMRLKVWGGSGRETKDPIAYNHLEGVMLVQYSHAEQKHKRMKK